MAFEKYDKLGQEIKPGDVCVRNVRDGYKSTIEFCVYRGESWGGEKSEGKYGRFVTPNGNRSIKYTSVLFAFDPMGERRTRADQVINVTKQYYERNK